MRDFEETKKLILKAQAGDEEAKEFLIEDNMPLIKSIVKRYRGKTVEYDDLIQLGSLGLLKAILNFDISYGVKFSTYAVPMIAGEIKRYIRDDGSIKVSRALKLASYKIAQFCESYNHEYNREPTIDEIAENLGIEKEEAVFAMESTRFPLSLYEKADEESGLTLIDKIVIENSDDDVIDKLQLFDVIKNLPDRDKKIILLRYFRDKTQSEVAEELGVSQVQVSRLESKIIEKLKNELDEKI